MSLGQRRRLWRFGDSDGVAELHLAGRLSFALQFALVVSSPVLLPRPPIAGDPDPFLPFPPPPAVPLIVFAVDSQIVLLLIPVGC